MNSYLQEGGVSWVQFGVALNLENKTKKNRLKCSTKKAAVTRNVMASKKKDLSTVYVWRIYESVLM